MAIFKRGNIWYFRVQRNGKEYKFSLGTSDVNEAQELAAKAKENLPKRKGNGQPKHGSKAHRRLFGTPHLSEHNKDWGLMLGYLRLSRFTPKTLSGMRSRAKKKGMECSLTEADIDAMLVDSEGMCAVSGLPFLIRDRYEDERVNPWQPSIDRIKSDEGYTRENCRVVCYIANLAMSQFGEDALTMLSQAVVERDKHRRSKNARV
jgi:hypothetical protein